MGKTATDAAADAFVAGLMVGFDRIADEKLTAKVDALEQRIVERLPRVVALPPKPAENPLERLLSVGEVADRSAVLRVRYRRGWIRAIWFMYFLTRAAISGKSRIRGWWSICTASRVMWAK